MQTNNQAWYTWFLQRCVIICLISLWILTLLATADLGIDFYPLYFGAARIVQGQSPYGAEATAALAAEWSAPFAAAGIGYPLPLLVLVIPLCALPFPLAAGCWTLLGCAMLVWGVAQIAADSRTKALIWFLPLAFLPFFRGVVLGQATLLWVGLAALLLSGVKRDWPWLVAVCVPLLVLKPQTGVVFALYGAYWLWSRDRARLGVSVGIGLLLALIAFALQPSWIGDWLAQVRAYRAVVQPPSILLQGLVLAAFWQGSLWGRLAIIQVALFPLSDLYSGLPLLLAWATLPIAFAFPGAAISWLWLFLQLPTSTATFVGVLMLPLVGMSIWRRWYSWRNAAIQPAGTG